MKIGRINSNNSGNQRLSLKGREQRLAYVISAPTYLVVIGIIILPFLYNFWLAFQKVTVANIDSSSPISFFKWVITRGKSGSLPDFVGLRNFITLLQDPQVLSAFLTSLIYTFAGVVLSMILGLCAALLLHRRMPARGVIRGLFLMPYVIPLVAVSFLWKWILNPVYGVGNWVLMQIGVITEPISWLSTRGVALLTVILIQGWCYFPFVSLFVLARLQAIPESLYEAARTDGADTFQQFLYITLPQLKGILAILFLLRFVWVFTKFADVYLLTGGSAGTMVVPVLVKNYVMEVQRFGQGAVLSLYIFGFLAVFMFFYFRWVMEEE